MIRVARLIFWAAVFFSLVGVSAPGVRLTLEKSIQIALDQATSVIKSSNDVKLAGEQVVQAYSQFLPTVDLGLGYSYTGGTTLYSFTGVTVVTSAGQNAQFTLSSDLNLFNGLGDHASLEKALRNRDASQQSLSWARQQIAMDVTGTYLQLILDQELSRIAQMNLDASRARLKLLQGQARVGSAAIADLYRQQAQESSDQLSLSTAVSRARDDQILLIRKLRLNSDGIYEVETPSLDPTPSEFASKPIEAMTREAVESRPDYQALESRLEAANWDIRRARSNYYPKLDLSFSSTSAGHVLTQLIVNGANTLPPTQGDLFGQVPSQTQFSIGLNLSWNLLNHGLTRLDVANSTIARDNADVDAADGRLQVQSDVKTAMNDYQVALDQIQTARTGLSAAEQAYDAIDGRYRVGASSFIDLLTAQAALTLARANDVQARVNLVFRKSALALVLGRELPGGDGL